MYGLIKYNEYGYEARVQYLSVVIISIIYHHLFSQCIYS